MLKKGEYKEIYYPLTDVRGLEMDCGRLTNDKGCDAGYGGVDLGDGQNGKIESIANGGGMVILFRGLLKNKIWRL